MREYILHSSNCIYPGGGLERIYSEISVGELKTIEDANYSKRVISGGMRMNAVILLKTSLSVCLLI
jgi:hypothetical protein